MPPKTLMTPEDVARELEKQGRTIHRPWKLGQSSSRGVYRPFAIRRNRDLTREIGEVRSSDRH